MAAVTQECITSHLSDPDEFEAWLTKNADVVVGTTADPLSCPIHQFLAEACEAGGEKFSVSSAHVKALNKEMDWAITITLPSWARGFILYLDGRYRGAVTGKVALEPLQMAIEHSNVRERNVRERNARATG